jgi:hypothetical protein
LRRGEKKMRVALDSLKDRRFLLVQRGSIIIGVGIS